MNILQICYIFPGDNFYPTQMIAYMIIAAAALALIGLATLYRAFRGATQGYQDEYGFHEGSDPQHPLVLGAANQVAMAGSASRISQLGARSRRALKRVSKEPVTQGSAVPFPH